MTAAEKFKVNVLYRGKERWKYCTTLKKAEYLQRSAAEGGISSIILKKVNGKYLSINSKNETNDTI